MGSELASQVPVNVCGSSQFGIYPKIDLEKTYNMFITDGWLCNYAGFQLVNEIAAQGEGRGLFHSIRGGFLIAVVNSTVYLITSSLTHQIIGNIDTQNGEVSIDENLAQQICIVDGRDAYIYHYNVNNPTTPGTLTKQTQPLFQQFSGDPIVPGFVEYHNSFFLISSALNSINPQNWYAFQRASDTTISRNSEFPIQTKPDRAIAIQRLPGKANHILVLGEAVSEVWVQVGGAQNYQRVSSYSVDYGCASVSTIASSEEFVAWLGRNENNASSIMTSDGQNTKRISTDGIDHLLESLVSPEQSTAMFYRQNGHLFYQLTFFNPRDNLTLIYDFTTEKFFHVCDEKQNYHPARQIVYYNEATYFISLNNGSLYQMGDEFDTYNYELNRNAQGEDIPRMRICKPIRKEDSSIFRAGMFTFWIEQGVNNFMLSSLECDGFLITENASQILITEDGDYILSEQGMCFNNSGRPRVDMTISKNGNQSFSNVVSRELNTQGNYRNQIRWHRMGQANELTVQLRFWGFQRFVVNNGVMEVY